MGESRGVPALAMVALLVLAAVTADEPSSPLDVALSAEGQTPEPVSPAKLEASGESDLTTSAQRPGRGPILDVPSQSNESEEGVEHDMDSEEAAASQGI